MISKCEGIILKCFPFKESDLILKVLTREKGIASFIMKGGQSSKRRGGTPLGPLIHAELTYFQGNSELLQLREAVLIDGFASLRESYDHLEAALLMIKKVLVSQIGQKPAPNIFNLLHYYLKRLPALDTPRILSCSFTLKVLLHEGLFDPVNRCSVCREDLAELLLSEGQSFCPLHAPGQAQSFTLDEAGRLMLLAYGRDFNALAACPWDSSLEEKIEAIFSVAF